MAIYFNQDQADSLVDKLEVQDREGLIDNYLRTEGMTKIWENDAIGEQEYPQVILEFERDGKRFSIEMTEKPVWKKVQTGRGDMVEDTGDKRYLMELAIYNEEYDEWDKTNLDALL